MRRFLTPPNDDVANTLMTVGNEFGLNGFANATFIRDKATGEHLLIELDMRPNRFHQYGPALGVDWIELLLDPPRNPVVPTDLPPEGRLIYNYPFDIYRALKHKKITALMPWLTRDPGTWDTRNHRDKAVNSYDRKILIRQGAQALIPHGLVTRLRILERTFFRRPAP